MLAVFRPITADAKLRMNPRSDVDFSSPKVDLVVNLREVAVELNRPQVMEGDMRERERCNIFIVQKSTGKYHKNHLNLQPDLIWEISSTMCIG